MVRIIKESVEQAVIKVAEAALSSEGLTRRMMGVEVENTTTELSYMAGTESEVEKLLVRKFIHVQIRNIMHDSVSQQE